MKPILFVMTLLGGIYLLASLSPDLSMLVSRLMVAFGELSSRIVANLTK